MINLDPIFDERMIHAAMDLARDPRTLTKVIRKYSLNDIQAATLARRLKALDPE
jgi:hypothetical protein